MVAKATWQYWVTESGTVVPLTTSDVTGEINGQVL